MRFFAGHLCWTFPPEVETAEGTDGPCNPLLGVGAGEEIAMELIAVYPLVRIWTGEKNFEGASEVPDAALTKRRVSLVPPELIRQLERLRAALYKKCEGHGVPFLNGYLMSASAFRELAPDLQKAEEEFSQSVAYLAENIGQIVADWAASRTPEVRERILERWAEIEPSVVGGRLAEKFRWDVASFSLDAILNQRGVQREIEDIPRKLAESLADEFGEALAYYEKAGRLTQKAVARLTRILAKAKSFAGAGFGLDVPIQAVEVAVGGIIAAIKAVDGPIERGTTLFDQIVSVLAKLADAEAILKADADLFVLSAVVPQQPVLQVVAPSSEGESADATTADWLTF